ncbi:unnamed protein product [Arabidopsis arenosa]|uniref:RRM domain-containing protein n=1 Tax=Arabidopsis arenosa TaxID=38785 RepID=A0A8S2A3S0_ARAAE|nr:unnamed protein product [Arabidopsis arenosa]
MTQPSHIYSSIPTVSSSLASVRCNSITLTYISPSGHVENIDSSFGFNQNRSLLPHQVMVIRSNSISNTLPPRKSHKRTNTDIIKTNLMTPPSYPGSSYTKLLAALHLVPTNPPHKFTGDERNFENLGGEKCKDSNTKMTKGVDGLTFPMSRESESASRLKTFISDMLPRFTDDYSDDLSEYVTVLVCNGKNQRQVSEDLEAFLREQSWKFVTCLWELLVNYFSQSNSASGPKTAVDFGFHDTLIEQGLSSRNHGDYDREAADGTNSMNEQLISVTAPIEDTEAPVSPKVEKMKMLRQELIDSPCTRARRKKKEDWNSSGYSRKILRSVIVSATKQPCDRNPAKYEKSMNERSRILKKRPYLPERELDSQFVPIGRAVSPHQEMAPHVSVWDRLGRASSKRVLDSESRTLSKFGIKAHENKVLQQHGQVFPEVYSEQHSEIFQREVPAVGYRHRVSQSDEARKPESGIITSTEPHIAYNLNRKRRYSVVNPNSGEFSSVLQYKQAEEDVEMPSLLSYQSPKPDIFAEIKNVKEKMQELELRIFQSKQLKKQKVEELKPSPQSGESQYQQDVTESRIIHVTNVYYAAKKEAISMLFSSKCGAVENVTIVTDPVTQHPKGTAFVTFAAKESVNQAIALSGTMFYSRPIKVQRHVIASGVVSLSAPQIVTAS